MVLACRSRERGEAAAFDLRLVREGGALEGGAWRGRAGPGGRVNRGRKRAG